MKKTQVSLVFDDGFIDSCLKVADLFEARNLRATFAVLVNHDGFMPKFPKGDFDLWNALQDRGHVIHPHGVDHSDLSAIPHADAVQKIDNCIEAFSDKLKGFDAKKAVYHLTYNRSTPAIDDVLLSRFAAIRTCGSGGQVGTGMNNRMDLERRIFQCAWHGPDFGVDSQERTPSHAL